MKKLSALTLLSVCSILMSSPNARAADSAIVFGGVPVDLKISEVSQKTVRIELQPVEAQTNSRAVAPAWTLASFTGKEIFHAHDLASTKKIRVGALRLTIQPRPLMVSVRDRRSTRLNSSHPSISYA